MTATKKKPRRKPRRKAKRGKTPGEKVGEINGFEVRRIKVSKIQGADYNPRVISESNLAGLKASVDQFGLPQAIVWNAQTRNVVGGHQRLKTLDPASTTDVVVVDLTEEEEKALNLAFNNPHVQGDWTPGLAGLIDSIEKVNAELFSSLKLDELRIEVPDLGGGLAPPEEFPEVTAEGLSTDHECPRCGFEFS